MSGNVVRIRELNTQQKQIKETVEYDENTAEQLLDDMIEFQSNVDKVGLNGNMRMDFFYMEAFELDDGDVSADGYHVQLTMLRDGAHEVIEIETLFPNFRIALEIMSSQLLFSPSDDGKTNIQMTSKGFTPDEMCQDNFRGDITFVISRPPRKM